MPAFTYKCPSCGNALKFMPGEGNFACEFCGSTYDEAYLKTLDEKAYAQEAAAQGTEAGRQGETDRSGEADQAESSAQQERTGQALEAGQPQEAGQLGEIGQRGESRRRRSGGQAGPSASSGQGTAFGYPAESGQDHKEYLCSCPSCGAELVTTDTTAATTCYYCHNPVVIVGRLEDAFKPDALLPFKYDKMEARERFFAWMRKKRYVPKAFISESSVQNLSGVYYPYWLADYEASASFTGEGTIVTHSETPKYHITTTKYYSVSRDGDISFRNLQRSALQKADRKLSDGVHPYRMDDLIDFAPSYLSGFMAEKRDVAREAIQGSIEEELKGYAQPMLASGSPYSSLVGSTTMKLKDNKYRYALLPAWVLTYKGEGGAMYYYAMNGQTSEVCGALPIDKKKLLLHGGILAALLCGALLGVFYFLV
jgi:DNA-directed RNA polymerase subunit RPC12/RpoP